MSSDQPIRLTLPSHLVEKIRALLIHDIARQLDAALKLELKEAVKAAEPTRSDDTRAAAVNGADTEQKGSSIDRGVGEEPSEDGTADQTPVDPPAPPTIAEETLENVSRWADTKVGRGVLRRYNLEAAEYSLIALLAGTQIYIPPSRLARLKAAEPVDKPNPYLPTYLSPQPPSIGREFSSLTKQLTTVLNVLFSIFGSAFAVYVAGTTGAGYTRETSILLGVLAGAVVGIAEAILVWIFSARVQEGRRERWERGAKMGRGSAALGVKGGDGGDEAEQRTLEGIRLVTGDDVEGTDGDDDEVPESQAAFEVEEGVGSVTDTSAMVGGAGRGIRLRRPAIGSTA